MELIGFGKFHTSTKVLPAQNPINLNKHRKLYALDQTISKDSEIVRAISVKNKLERNYQYSEQEYEVVQLLYEMWQQLVILLIVNVPQI